MRIYISNTVVTDKLSGVFSRHGAKVFARLISELFSLGSVAKFCF